MVEILNVGNWQLYTVGGGPVPQEPFPKEFIEVTTRAATKFNI